MNSIINNYKDGFFELIKEYIKKYKKEIVKENTRILVYNHKTKIKINIFIQHFEYILFADIETKSAKYERILEKDISVIFQIENNELIEFNRDLYIDAIDLLYDIKKILK